MLKLNVEFDYDALIAARKRSAEIMNEPGSFHEKWSRSWEAKKPITDWAYIIFQKARRLKKLDSLASLHAFVYRNDMNYKDQDSFHKASTIVDDDQFTITTWIDYDCDTCLAKYRIRHKPSGLMANGAIDLGAHYCNMAPYSVSVDLSKAERLNLPG